jgi:hypothetical protein
MNDGFCVFDELLADIVEEQEREFPAAVDSRRDDTVAADRRPMDR